MTQNNRDQKQSMRPILSFLPLVSLLLFSHGISARAADAAAPTTQAAVALDVSDGSRATQIPSDAWENPSIFQVNRMPARSPLWPHPDAASALATPGYQHGSPWVRCINGEWRFHWAAHPDNRPVNFQEPGFDDSQWKFIPVPGCVELYGYGTPVYCNSTYPFKVDPPRVMGEPPKQWTAYRERNPVSSFRRWVKIPADWAGRRIYLQVGAAGGCLSAWVNGKTIGYSEDSRLAAEFDITEAVHPGQNLIALQVLRNSDGTYLEDQDIWRLSGIFRDVTLFSRPSVHLWDVAVESALDAQCRDATLRLRCQVMNQGAQNSGPVSVRMRMRDPEGNLVKGVEVVIPVEGGLAPGKEVELISNPVDLKAVRKWSFDNPALYTAVVELLGKGKPREAVAMRVGFRKVELKDQQFTLNGKPVKLRGVNRHDWHPTTGYVVDEATMREDIRRIKQANLNAVRTSHYPNDPRFVEMCSELGLLVLAEANIESHGLSYHKCVLPGDLPEWEAPTVERMRRLVIRDRSQPSVVMWSLGNEAGYGSAFEKEAAEVRRLDAEKRPIQYADMNAPCDVDSQTYPSPDWLLQHVNGKAVRKGERGEISSKRQHGQYPSGKPFLMNEYAWAGGNNLGNFQEYWDVIEAHPMLIGGFIWDWADKGLATVEVGGKNVPLLSLRDPHAHPLFHAIGGAFGDLPNDGTFVLNGLLESDRSPKPHYAAVAQVNRPIRVFPVDPKTGLIRIENRNFDLPLSEFVATWQWADEGRPVATGTLPRLECAPGASVQTAIAPPAGLGRDRCLTVRFALGKARGWANAGFVVGWDQLFQEQTPVLPELQREQGQREQGQAETAREQSPVGTARRAVLGFQKTVRGEEQPPEHRGRLGETALPDRALPSEGQVTFQETAQSISIAGPGFAVGIGKDSGMIERLSYGGRELLVQPFRLDFGRPQTTNDRGWKMPEVLKPWQSAGDQAKALETKVTREAGGAVTVVAKIVIPVATSHAEINYTVDAAGSILVRGSATLEAPAPANEVARIGLQAGIIPSLDRVQWYGLGPVETYPDRKAAGLLGLWSANARQWNHSYLPPQETGHRCDVRFARITDAKGIGLRVNADREVFGMSLWPWTAADLEQAHYPYQLKERDFLVLILDSFQMGLGGTFGWGGRPLDAYRLRTGRTYDFGFGLQPADQ